MNFQVAWHGPSATQPNAYLFTDNGVIPQSGPWFGVMVTSKPKQRPEKLTALAHFFSMALNENLYHSLSFVTFDDGVAAADVKAFETALAAHNWAKGGSAALIWIPSTKAFTESARLPMKSQSHNPKKGKKVFQMALDAPAGASLMSLDSGGTAALVTQKGSIVVDSNAVGDAIEMQSKGPIAFALGKGSANFKSPIFVTRDPGGLAIPLSGASTGCLTGIGLIGAASATIGPKIRYEVALPAASPNSDVEQGGIDYPILNAADALRGCAIKFSITPNAPMDAARSCMLFSTVAPFETAFRTRSGEVLSLAPQSGAALSFDQNNDNEAYLTLSGEFAISVPDTPATFDLLCGLSGVEYLSLVPGDVLSFQPNEPAGILYAPGQGISGADEQVFSADKNSRASTAYAKLTPASQSPERGYFAEPDSSPFFANQTGATSPSQLDYLAVARTNLSGAAGPKPQPFPIAPYAQLSKSATGPGSNPATVRAIELQYLNPLRLAAIKATGTPAAATAKVTQALTPQGHLATFTNGKWTDLQVAQMPGTKTNVDISFTAKSGDALPEPLQQAFLTNQQFLVISEATDNLGDHFKPTIVLDGWTFDFDLLVNTAIGTYHNVLIFKSADATLAQLAATPELWTGRSDFTSASDPEGTYISNWLVGYIADARALYDDGRGVASLSQFIEIVDDPNWNGFLILNLKIKPGALEPEIKALLAGIDENLFAAHHVGNLANHITDTSGSYNLDSAIFGLVRYTDPGFQVDMPDVGYITNPNDYDFRVLTLEAIFEDAVLTHFSNKSRLTANLLFGDPVLPIAPPGQSPRNSLVILGSYKHVGGVPVYTFATAPGTTGKFFVSSNALEAVTFTKATMAVVKTSDGYAARFGFWGRLAFQENLGFDLLSFTRLAFQNLAIDMVLTPNAAGGANAFERSFTFSTGAMALERAGLRKLPSGSPPPANSGDNLIRDTGWLASFPLKIKGLISGDAGTSPTDKGYWPLKTVAPKGISQADLSDKPWYALSFDMTLGSKGALASNAVLGADVLLAWTPGGSGGVSISPMVKLVGPEGMSLSFDIEGVVKFGAKDVVLNKIKRDASSTEPDMFVMIFESIALRVLMLSFPPAGTTNVYLLGGLDTIEGNGSDEVNPTLGWVGGYQAKSPS